MNGLEMIQYIHNEMAETNCFATILKDWGACGSMLESHMKKLHLTDEHFKYGLTENLGFCDMTFNADTFFKYIQRTEERVEEDVYFSINSFYNKVRNTNNIRHLNAFAIDYDFYKKKEYKHKTPEEMWEIIKPTLPKEPTFVVSSGRGLYVIYALYHSPIACLAFYQAIYKRLVELQYEYGADPAATLATQVIRVPGSINSRNLADVEIIYHNDIRYHLKDFEDILRFSYQESRKYLDYKKKHANKIKMKSRRKRINNNLFLQDISKIIELRNENGEYTGYRELLLYLVWERLQHQKWDIDKIKDILETINNKFESPMSLEQVYKQCKPSGGFRFCSSIQTVIRKLNITRDEQKYMKLLICDTERLRRYQNGIRKTMNQTKKQRELKNRREKLLFLLCKNHQRLSEISKILNVSIKTLKRDLEYIRNHMALFEKILKEIFLSEIQTEKENIYTIVEKYIRSTNALGQKLLL